MRALRRRFGILLVLGGLVAAITVVRERGFARSEAEFARIYGAPPRA